MGLKEAKDNSKILESAVKESLISGQRPVVTALENPSLTSKLDRECLWS